jgi:tRNA dimethylallyltransferase
VKFNLIVILGPTASGKTRLAALLAHHLGAEIISADSRQIYRGMDIGTGKDIQEYTVQDVPVPYHLIDILNPIEEFSVFEYQKLFFRCYKEIQSKGILPIMVGGTGLYIESVLKGYHFPPVPENTDLRKELEKSGMESLIKRLFESKPNVHNTTDLKDRARLIRAIEIAEYNRSDVREEAQSNPDVVPLVIGIHCERNVLRQRISERLKDRLENGMIEEVKRLHESGIPWERLDYFGLEYRYVGLYLQKEINYNDMFQQLRTRIQQFAKKQETWFRRMEKREIAIHWFNYLDDHGINAFIKKHFQKKI